LDDSKRQKNTYADEQSITELRLFSLSSGDDNQADVSDQDHIHQL
jgi:hypothetical protein